MRGQFRHALWFPPCAGIGHNNVGGMEFRGRNLLLPADRTQALIRVWPFSAIGTWSILLTPAKVALMSIPAA
jgi:hypothetical protein